VPNGVIVMKSREEDLEQVLADLANRPHGRHIVRISVIEASHTRVGIKTEGVNAISDSVSGLWAVTFGKGGFSSEMDCGSKIRYGERMNDGDRFQMALERFDEENSHDPHWMMVDGQRHPRELLYARWLTEWILKLLPDASEVLRLAARSQHLCRWMIPRNSYEMTRAGYLRWRADLKQFHARKSAEILREIGYAEDVIQRVQDLNLKKALGRDPECQALEDALCLVTLQYQLADLVSKTAPEKMVGILAKTWKKMSPNAREYALQLPFPEREKELIERALGNSDAGDSGIA
jgi:hypothetical protein